MKYQLDIPPAPPGFDFARDTFWWTYCERFARPRKFRWKIKPIAYEWFDREERKARLEGKAWPPTPVFRKMSPPVPQPRDGKDGANGWTPRKG